MKYLLAFILLSLFLIWRYYWGYDAGEKSRPLIALPTQSEVQEILGVEVDGVIGAESRRVWDEFIERRVCEDFARPHMEKFNKQFNKFYGLDEN